MFKIRISSSFPRIIGLMLILLTGTWPCEAKKYAWEYDYKKLEKEATKGDPSSQYWMGQTFEEGRLGKTPDIQKAFEWYLKAAKQDLSYAQWKVAMMYFYGNGVAKDDTEHLHWIKSCANSRYDDDDKFRAKILLSDYMANGKYGMEKNVNKAIDLLKKARLNHYDSSGRDYFLYAKQQQTLGQLYMNLANEILLSDDYDSERQVMAYENAAKAFEEEAMDWSRFKANGDKEYQMAKENMGEAWKNSALAWIFYETYSDSTENTKTNSKIIDALEYSAYQGHTGAIYGLGEFYYYGEFGLPQDKKKGLKYLSKIAEVNSKAAYILASDYYENKDYPQAHRLFTMLSEMDGVDNDVRSSVLRTLSTLYRFGRGVEKNEKKADRLISEAAKLGDPDAEKIQKWLSVW